MTNKTIFMTSIIAMTFLIGITANYAIAADIEVIEGTVTDFDGDLHAWQFTGTDATSTLEVTLVCGNTGDPSEVLDPVLGVQSPSIFRSDDDSFTDCDFFSSSIVKFFQGDVEDGCWITRSDGFSSDTGPYTLTLDLSGPGDITPLDTVPEDCVPITCPEGFKLVDDECVPFECPEGFEFIENECVPIECPEGFELIGNECLPIECEEGFVLIGNECIPEELCEAQQLACEVPFEDAPLNCEIQSQIDWMNDPNPDNIALQVFAIDPFCIDFEWDSICELEYDAFCTVDAQAQFLACLDETPCEVPLASIHVLKFHDLNGDGIQDIPEEEGIPGWGISLQCEDDIGDVLIILGETDEDGMVWFVDIPAPNLCEVSEELRDGWTPTTPSSVSVELNQGDEIEVVFGNAQTGQIDVLKFNDLNGDGVQDLPEEDGIPGWEITLDCESEAILTEETDDDGMVRFAEILAPTECIVSEETRPGWTATTPPRVDFELNQGDEREVIFGNVRPLETEKFYTETDKDIEAGFFGTVLPFKNAIVDTENPTQVVKAVVDKNGNIKSYNPGQYYAVTKVTAFVDLATVWIFEEDLDCTEREKPISIWNPVKIPGGAYVAIMCDGETEDITKELAKSGALFRNPNTGVLEAHVEDVKAGCMVFLGVKYSPGLKGETLDQLEPEELFCKNWEIVCANLTDEPNDISNASTENNLISCETDVIDSAHRVLEVVKCGENEVVNPANGKCICPEGFEETPSGICVAAEF